MQSRSSEIDLKLINAVESGDLTAVTTLLEQKANANVFTKDGCTPLMAAMRHGYIEVALLLLVKKADINARGKNGITALHLATLYIQSEILKRLLDIEGIQIDACLYNNATPLMIAAANGYMNGVNRLILKKANVNASQKSGMTPLHLAAANNQTAVVKRLLDTDGILVDPTLSNGLTPLMIAVMNGHAQTADVLIKSKANVLAHYREGGTPLLDAVRRNDISLVKQLLQTGKIDIDAPFAGETKTGGMNLLMVAAEQGYLDMVKLCLERKANIHATCHFGGTPLLYAALNGRVEVVEFLLGINGIQVNAPIQGGKTPLIAAAECGRTEVVKQLLNAEGMQDNVDLASYQGITPLMMAARGGYLEIIDLLLKKQANVNRQSKEGRATPLQLAIRCGQTQAAKRLLEAKEINVNLPATEGITPLMLASKKGYLEVVNLLLQKEADVNAQDKDGNTALDLAIERNQTAIVEQLLKAEKIQVDVSPDTGITPLMFACQEGHLAIVELLLNKKANIWAKDKDGETPLHFAVRMDRVEVVARLLKIIAIPAAHSKNPIENKQASQDVCESKEDKSEINQAAEIADTLRLAAMDGNVQIVKMLLEVKGIEVDLADKDGITPLMVAAFRGYVAVANLLIQHKAKINMSSAQGHTPLIYAASQGQVDMVATLLDRKADPLLPDNGSSVIQFAVACGHFGMLETFYPFFLEGEKADFLKKMIKAHLFSQHPTGVADPSLFAAVEAGNVNLIEQWLVKDVNVNVPASDGTTLLMAAVKKGHAKIVQQLVQHGANITAHPTQGVTPFHIAVAEGKVDCMNILLRTGKVNVNIPTLSGLTPLMLAVMNGHLEAVKRLLQEKRIEVTLNLPGKNGITPLALAAGKGDLNIAQHLLRHKANINELSLDGSTPLLCAVREGQIAMVEELLEIKGIDIDQADNSGMTPLMWAAEKRHPDIVTRLLQYHAKVNVQCKSGLTALGYAVRQNQTEIVERLLEEKEIQVDLPASDGTTPLIYAMKKGMIKSFDILYLLLQHSANINAQVKSHGMTVLLHAIKCGRVDIVDRLLQSKEIQVDMPTREGLTPLRLAVMKDRGDIVDLLLRRQANANVVLNNKLPLLGYAAWHGKVDIVKKLLQVDKMEVDLPSRTGLTPLMYAAKEGHLEVIHLLLEKKAKINAQQPQTGETPLLHAVKGGNVEIVRALLDAKADSSIKLNDGADALAVARAWGETKVIDILNNAPSDADKPFHSPESGGSSGEIKTLAGLPLRTAELPSAEIRKETFSTDGKVLLLNAIEKGEVDTVKTLIGQKVGLHVRSPADLIPLLYAINKDQPQIIAELLKADINISDVKLTNGGTLLTYAVEQGNITIVNLLLKARMTLSSQVSIDPSQLMANAFYQYICNIDSPLTDGRTALFLAIEKGYLNITASLLNAKANMEAKDNKHKTPLMWAIIRKAPFDIIDLLLKHAADQGALFSKRVVSADGKGVTPLLYAIHFDQAKIVEKLIHAKANMEEKCSVQEKNASSVLTPLQWAVRWGKSNSVKTLLECHANPYVIHNGYNLLEMAARCGYPSILQTLYLDYLEKMNWEWLKGEEEKAWINLFAFACRSEPKSTQKYLDFIKSECKRHATPPKSASAPSKLLHAIEQQDEKMVLQLLEDPFINSLKEDVTLGAWADSLFNDNNTSQSDVSLVEDSNMPLPMTTLRNELELPLPDGRTPLLLAASLGNLFIMEQLINAQAKVDVKCNGMTVLGYAIRCSTKEDSRARIVERLIEAGAKIEEGVPAPLIHAIYKDNLEVVSLLIDKKADLKGEIGNHAIQIARKRGNQKIIDKLLEVLPSLVAQRQLPPPSSGKKRKATSHSESKGKGSTKKTSRPSQQACVRGSTQFPQPKKGVMSAQTGSLSLAVHQGPLSSNNNLLPPSGPFSGGSKSMLPPESLSSSSNSDLFPPLSPFAVDLNRFFSPEISHASNIFPVAKPLSFEICGLPCSGGGKSMLTPESSSSSSNSDLFPSLSPFPGDLNRFFSPETSHASNILPLTKPLSFEACSLPCSGGGKSMLTPESSSSSSNSDLFLPLSPFLQ